MKVISTKLTISLLLLTLVSPAGRAEPASSLSSAADQVARRMAEAFKPLWGTVLSVLPDDRFVLDVAAENGVYVGMEMEVFREGEPFKHPVTGKVLGRMDRQVGVVRVVEVKEKFSLGEGVFLVKGEEVRQGDGTRVTAARIIVGLANITSMAIDEAYARGLTREIEAALLKTGRFEVMDERAMRSTLAKMEVVDTVPLTDPDALGILRSTLRLHAVIFPVVRAAEDGLMVELKAVSSFSDRPLYLASAEVGRVQETGNAQTGTQALAASSAPFAGPSPRASLGGTRPAGAAGEPMPAWIGPPTQHRGPPAGFVEPRVSTTIIPHPLVLIKVGHVTGGGPELVGVSRDHVFVYRWVERVLKPILDYGEPNSSRQILHLSVADINGNGRDEIFVTQLESLAGGASGIINRLTSYALEFDGIKLVPVWENVPLYLRALAVGDQQYLIAERMGERGPFKKPLLHYVWQENRYVKKALFPVPDGLNVYDFALGDLTADETAEIIRLSDEGKLQVYRIQSGAYLGGSEEKGYGRSVHIRFEQHDQRVAEILTSQNSDTSPELTTRLLPGEIRPVGLGDRGRGVIVAENLGGFYAKYRASDVVFPDESRLVFLAWQARGFQRVCQTRLIDRYTASFDVADVNGDGEPEILLLTLQPRAAVVGGFGGEAWLDILYGGACR